MFGFELVHRSFPVETLVVRDPRVRGLTTKQVSLVQEAHVINSRKHESILYEECTPFFENVSFLHFFFVQSLALSLRVSSLVQASEACRGSDDLGSFAQDLWSEASLSN
jgi:hypothetical protein